MSESAIVFEIIYLIRALNHSNLCPHQGPSRLYCKQNRLFWAKRMKEKFTWVKFGKIGPPPPKKKINK